MRRLIKLYLIETATLYLVSVITSGLVFADGIVSLLLAGLGLMLVTVIAKPLINLLLLPLNLITFGLFRWVSATLVLYLATLIVPGFRILNFSFPGFSTPWFSLPVLHLTGVLAFIAFSFLISFVTGLLHWLIK
jgi:putative membrane protein